MNYFILILAIVALVTAQNNHAEIKKLKQKIKEAGLSEDSSNL